MIVLHEATTVKWYLVENHKPVSSIQYFKYIKKYEKHS